MCSGLSGAKSKATPISKEKICVLGRVCCGSTRTLLRSSPLRILKLSSSGSVFSGFVAEACGRKRKRVHDLQPCERRQPGVPAASHCVSMQELNSSFRRTAHVSSSDARAPQIIAQDSSQVPGCSGNAHPQALRWRLCRPSASISLSRTCA